jgi:nucleoside-diphosphate-sugar epimerase
MTTEMDMAPPQRILVTGGAGFIGHRVIRWLSANHSSAKLAILDNLSVGMPMPAATANLQTYASDIRDADELQKIFKEFAPDTVIHLAAVHHIPTCETRRSYALDVNVVGTENVLEAASLNKVQRFTLASSGAVYDWNAGALREDESALKPADNYSVAKYANETQVRLWADRTDSSVRIARIFNTIGHDDPNAHLIPDIISQITPGAAVASIGLGNLTPRRDYIHADDTSRAIAMMTVAASGRGTEVFNVSTGADVSVAELVVLLGEVMGTDISVTEDKSRIRRIDRPSQLGSTEKIRKHIGFAPEKNLRIALGDILQKQRSHSSKVA